MNVKEFKQVLSDNPDCEILFSLPDDSVMPPHFHITEIGNVTKNFVDCGGVRRKTESCMLQTLVATDTEHRLKTTKLKMIFGMASELGLEDHFPVEAEIQGQTIAIYSVGSAKTIDGRICFQLEGKRTECLAPDKCGIPLISLTVENSGGGCGPSGCC